MIQLLPKRNRKKRLTISVFSSIDKSTVFEGNNKIGRLTSFKSAYLGFGSYIGNNCRLSKAKIGRYCSIGNNVQVISGKHPVNECISSHPAFFSIKKENTVSFVDKQYFNETNMIDNTWSIVVGNDVWIGSNVIILEGVSIGDGAIIACGSVVIKDVADYSVVAGVPAIIKKYRFSDNQIKLLKKIEWWNWSQEEIRKNSHLFNYPSIFFETFNDKDNDEQ